MKKQDMSGKGVDKHDLSVELSGITLKNPVIPASGCFGYGYGMKDFYDPDILGSISFKGDPSKKP